MRVGLQVCQSGDLFDLRHQQALLRRVAAAAQASRLRLRRLAVLLRRVDPYVADLVACHLRAICAGL